MQSFVKELEKDESTFTQINLVDVYLCPQEFPSCTLSQPEKQTAQRHIFLYRLLDVSSWRSLPIPGSPVEASLHPTILVGIQTFIWLFAYRPWCILTYNAAKHPSSQLGDYYFQGP